MNKKINPILKYTKESRKLPKYSQTVRFPGIIEDDNDIEQMFSGRNPEFEQYPPEKPSHRLFFDDSKVSIASGVGLRRRKKKKGKVEPSGRMRGLEDIYLQRLDAKKNISVRGCLKPEIPDFIEPEWEMDDFVGPPKKINHVAERTLHLAGDQIVHGRRNAKKD